MNTILFLAAALVAQGANVPEAAKQEILRRGDLVTRHGDGIKGVDDMLATAFGPPADDSHKWFVSVVSTANCAYCNQLLKDWKASRELLAWANPDAPEKSWAHFNVYRYDDPTQKFRFAKLKVDGFPTVLIQPPRSRQFGDPSVVVFQRTGYNGKPAELAAEMSKALTAYVRRAAVLPLEQPKPIALNVSGGFEQSDAGEHGQQPPFTPIGPTPMSPDVMPFQIPPMPTGPQAATLEQLAAACPGADDAFLLQQLRARATVEQAQAAWRLAGGGGGGPAVPGLPTWLTVVLGLLGISNIGALIGLGLTLARSWRKSQNLPTILSDEQFEALKKALAELAGGKAKT